MSPKFAPFRRHLLYTAPFDIIGACALNKQPFMTVSSCAVPEPANTEATPGKMLAMSAVCRAAF